MSEGRIRYEEADGIATITLDRPAKRNALTPAMCRDLADAWRRLEASECARAAVLTGEGIMFCAGADLNDPPPRLWEAVPGIGVTVSKPIVAATAGAAIGAGVTLVMMCDLCVATEDCSFIYPEAKAGIALGLIASIAARVPHKFACEMLLTGRPIPAARAFDVGFVNRVVAPGAEVAEAAALAREMAGNAPLVMAMLKSMMAETLPKGPTERMYAAQALIERVLGSEDAQEGPRAFRERRKPRFTGR